MTGFDALVIVLGFITFVAGVAWMWEQLSPDRDLQEPWHFDEPMCPRCGSRSCYVAHR